MNEISEKSYPLEKADSFLTDQHLLAMLRSIEKGFFNQYLTYTDYVGEKLRDHLFLHIEEAFRAFWVEVMSSYWDKEANRCRAEFYGHRMLVILERVNLSYYLHPYTQLVHGMFLDFEKRAKHHLDLDINLTERAKNTDRFKLEPDQRSKQYDIPPIATLEPLFLLDDVKERKTKPKVKPVYNEPYQAIPEEIIDKHIAFLDSTKSRRSPLTLLEFQQLRLTVLKTVNERTTVTGEHVFHQVTNKTGITKDSIKKHFARFMRELLPDARPRWFTDSVAILFGIKNQDSVYKNWPTENDEM